ncbi:MAG: hypothetical protein K0V04_10955, partial [Deltaproteobacteria bacterium]|nr:hypothetical protein [Deltaproteobacteria bacterium]
PAALRSMQTDSPSDAQWVLHLIDLGVTQPTRRTNLERTGAEIAMIHGRATPTAQAHALGIAIATAVDRRAAALHGTRSALRDACRAAVAVWFHGDLGSEDTLRAKLEPRGCAEITANLSEARARPRTALLGLGLTLLGNGPADAAALDRYWWAPMGLVRDLALPPVPAVESPPSIRIEPLERETTQ